MKKAICLVSVLVITLLILGSVAVSLAQDGKSDTIIFIPKSTDVTYWLFLRKGASDKAKELGYKISYQGVATEADVAG
ncbi:MAG: sugar ABC transporter substrate-binding protein, partial [Candidatus Atribacteria bacterium]|nr:sugar ABC transporter substrate-binding protein [Candidatus Atribacteria bacterium]